MDLLIRIQARFVTHHHHPCHPDAEKQSRDIETPPKYGRYGSECNLPFGSDLFQLMLEHVFRLNLHSPPLIYAEAEN